MKHLDPKPQEDVEPEELLRQEIAKDPWQPRLKPITQDERVRGGLPAWIVRSFDTESRSINAKTKKQTQSYGCVVVKSLQWPGAFTIYSQNRTI